MLFRVAKKEREKIGKEEPRSLPVEKCVTCDSVTSHLPLCREKQVKLPVSRKYRHKKSDIQSTS